MPSTKYIDFGVTISFSKRTFFHNFLSFFVLESLITFDTFGASYDITCLLCPSMSSVCKCVHVCARPFLSMCTRACVCVCVHACVCLRLSICGCFSVTLHWLPQQLATCAKSVRICCALLYMLSPWQAPLRHRALPSPLELRLCTKSRSCNQGEPNQARSAACFSRCCCQANKATATGERERERRGIHRERVSKRGGVGECVAGVEVQLCGWAQDCCLIGFIHVCYFARFAADNWHRVASRAFVIVVAALEPLLLLL